MGGREGERGFTLATMIVILAVMAIFLTVAVQTATFQKRRENEQELIFRGNQFVEAIRLFRARNGRFPVALKELWEADPRVLRKEWKDPVTGEFDWVPVFLGQEGQSVGRPGTGGGVLPTPRPGSREPEEDEVGEGETGLPESGLGPGGDAERFPATTARGPIIGVHSRSCDDSIKEVDGRTKYCQWKFALDPKKQAGGKDAPPGPTPTPDPRRRRRRR